MDIAIVIDSNSFIYPDETPSVSLSDTIKYYQTYDSTSVTKTNTGYNLVFTDVPMGDYHINVEYITGVGYF